MTRSQYTRFRERYTAEVERSIAYYTHLNQQQPVKTYYVSKEEMDKMTEVKESCHKLKLGGTYKWRQ